MLHLRAESLECLHVVVSNRERFILEPGYDPADGLRLQIHELRARGRWQHGRRDLADQRVKGDGSHVTTVWVAGTAAESLADVLHQAAVERDVQESFIGVGVAEVEQGCRLAAASNGADGQDVVVERIGTDVCAVNPVEKSH